MYGPRAGRIHSLHKPGARLAGALYQPRRKLTKELFGILVALIQNCLKGQIYLKSTTFLKLCNPSPRRILPEASVLDVPRTQKLSELRQGAVDAVQAYDVMETVRLEQELGAAHIDVDIDLDLDLHRHRCRYGYRYEHTDIDIDIAVSKTLAFCRCPYTKSSPILGLH